MSEERSTVQKLIRFCILVAALSGTAYAEWTLAVRLDWNVVVALTVPAALDLYVIDATMRDRDVAVAVIAMISVSAASYTYAHDFDPVTTPLRIAVSAIAPLILWRLHVKPRTRKEILWDLPEGPAQQFEAPMAFTPADALGALAPREPVKPPQKPRKAPSAGKAQKPAEKPAGGNQTPRLSDEEARKVAWYAWDSGVTSRKAAPDVTRSHTTVAKWYAEFADEAARKTVKDPEPVTA
ncbi:hypothetical protein [Streptomyces malaysiensis]